MKTQYLLLIVYSRLWNAILSTDIGILFSTFDNGN
jgi:hypothetical protein